MQRQVIAKLEKKAGEGAIEISHFLVVQCPQF